MISGFASIEQRGFTYSEIHRMQCEARWCLDRMEKDARLRYLELVSKARGEDAAQELRAEIVRQWSARKEAAKV